MSSKVSDKRDTQTRPESEIWKFAEITLKISEHHVVEGSLQWSIFNFPLKDTLKQLLDSQTNEKFAKEQFFNIQFQKIGSVVNGTAIAESDFDILVVLNENNPLDVDEVKKIYKTLNANGKPLNVTEKDLFDIAEWCQSGILKQAKDAGIAVKTKEPKDYDQLQYYMLNIDGYEYDVLPAFKCLGNSFLVIWLSPDGETAKLTPTKALSTANTIQERNKIYHGFIEMIQICKLLVAQWNSDANHPRIKPCTFESIADSVANKMTSKVWNARETTFKDLLKEIWTVFATQIEDENGFVSALNNPKENLLEFFPRKSAHSKEANEWIQKFLAKSYRDLLQELNDILSKLKNPNPVPAHGQQPSIQPPPSGTPTMYTLADGQVMCVFPNGQAFFVLPNGQMSTSLPVASSSTPVNNQSTQSVQNNNSGQVSNNQQTQPNRSIFNCDWNVRNRTNETLIAEVDNRGKQTIPPGGNHSWAKGLGHQPTVHIYSMNGEALCSKKFVAIGSGECGVFKEGNEYKL